VTPEQCAIFQLFSHPLRLQMLTLLGQRPHTLLELTDKLKDPPFSATYGMVCSHFQLLRTARLTETVRVEEESKVIHWLVPDKLVDAVAALVDEARLELPRARKRAARKKPAKKKVARKKRG